jgi:hypothetical protein
MLNAYLNQRGMPFALSVAGFMFMVVLTLGLVSVASAEEPATERLSQTGKAAGDARESREFEAVTTDTYGVLRTEANPDVAKGESSVAKIGDSSVQQSTTFGDFWFYSVDVELFNDVDRDGYFHGIDILFDADTIYSLADVYVVAYLSYEGGPWNEYAVSEDITLFGSTSTDDYVMVTELLQGYPTGRYDVLLELYDADTGFFLAEMGPRDSFELVELPLEDSDLDRPYVAPAVAVTSGGGGSNSMPFLIALLGVLLLSRQRQRRE